MKFGWAARFSQEQMLLFGSVAVCGLLLLAATPSPGPESAGAPAISARATSFPVVGETPSLRPEVKSYEPSKNLFTPPGKMRLSLPKMAVPAPAAEPLALPLSRPAPDLYGLLQNKVSWPYRYIRSGQPAIPPADLDEASLQALRELKQPEFHLRKDLRGEREPKEDVVKTRDGRSYTGRLMDRDKSFRVEVDKVVLTYINPRTQKLDKWEFKPGEWEEIILSKTYEEHAKDESRKSADDPIRKFKLAQKLLDEWGMVPEARAELAAILDKKPDHAEAAVMLLKLHLEALEYEQAVSLLDRLIARAKSATRVRALRYWRGVVWMRFGLYERALEEFNESYPEVVEAGLEKSRCQMALGRLGDAVTTATSVVGLQGVAPGILAQTFAVRASALMRSGAPPEEARRSVDEALKHDSKNAEALNLRAALKAMAGDFKGAQADWVAALTGTPEGQYGSDAWFNLSILYSGGLKADLAAEIATLGLERDPASADLFTALAVADYAKDNLAGARSRFEKALSIEGAGPYPRYGLGSIDVREEKWDSALEHFAAAIRKNFYFVPLYYNTALVHYTAARRDREAAAALAAQGKAQEARTLEGQADSAMVAAEALLRKSLDLRPGARNVLVALASLHLTQGRIGEAHELLQPIPEDVKSEDGTLRFLEGVVAYLGDDANVERRMETARDIMQSAAAKGSAEGADWYQKIDLWLKTYVLLDEQFNRDDGRNVGAGWNNNDKDAFPIEIAGKRCKFSSKTKGGSGAEKDILYMSLERELPGENLHLVEMKFYPKTYRKVDMFGAMIFNQSGAGGGPRGMGIAFRNYSAQNRPQIAPLPAVAEEQLSKQNTLQGFAWNPALNIPRDEIHIRVQIHRPVEAQPTAEIRFWDPEKKEWTPVMQLPYVSTGKSFKLAFFVRARLDSEFEFDLDEVIVLERRQE
jgi:tetratricopeptide (TPR) repeat protein